MVVAQAGRHREIPISHGVLREEALLAVQFVIVEVEIKRRPTVEISRIGNQWEQLANDRLDTSFIVDGIHLGAAFLKVALRAKGTGRAVLITDAVAPAGCGPGSDRLGEIDVELSVDGSVRMEGGRLAGSVLLMDRAIGNVIRLAGVSLRDALTMATRNAARAGRVPQRQRGLAVGERADLVRFRFDEDASEMRVLGVCVGGERVSG